MLDPYENVSSTGEPPTTAADISSNDNNNLFSAHPLRSSVDNPTGGRQQDDSSPLSSGGRSRTLSVQELDSGYEASPSSIAEHQTFFGEQSIAVAAIPLDLLESCSLMNNPDGDFEFIDCHDPQTLFPESDSDDYDTCQDCCYSRTDSSGTTTAVCCSNCDSSSSDLSNNRPSSQPIQVPTTTQSARHHALSPEVRSRLEHSLGSLWDMYPRSLPAHLHSLGLIPENHPLSWPSIPHSALSSSSSRRAIALPSPRNHHVSMDIPRRMNNNNHHHPRNRRQIIDSEASSFCSSDDEGPEDVFNMSGEEPRSFLMTSAGSVPLPDIVLESTDSSRRGRSASVNLPLERRLEVIRGVGQRLRRMSDLFDQRRELCIAVMRLRNRRASDCFELRPS